MQSSSFYLVRDTAQVVLSCTRAGTRSRRAVQARSLVVSLLLAGEISCLALCAGGRIRDCEVLGEGVSGRLLRAWTLTAKLRKRRDGRLMMSTYYVL